MDDIQLPNFRTVRMSLVDVGDGDGRQPVKICVSPFGVTIYADGYGTKAVPDRPGVVIGIGVRDGELLVMIWADINQTDPTHVISLESAREAHRLPSSAT